MPKFAVGDEVMDKWDGLVGKVLDVCPPRSVSPDQDFWIYNVGFTPDKWRPVPEARLRRNFKLVSP